MAKEKTKSKVKTKRKRLKKKQLKEDTLVTYSVKVTEWAKQHFSQIVIGLIIIAVVIAFLLFTSQARQSAALEAEQMFGLALGLFRQGDIEGAKKSFTETAEQYSKAQAGVIALYFKGECNLKLSNYYEALVAFDEYLQKSGKFPLFREAAIIGKAIALEGDSHFKEAAILLEDLLKEMPEDDPRYLDVVFRTAIFCSRTADMQHKAKQYFQEVAEKASGRMKEQAEAAVAIFQNP